MGAFFYFAFMSFVAIISVYVIANVDKTSPQTDAQRQRAKEYMAKLDKDEQDRRDRRIEEEKKAEADKERRIQEREGRIQSYRHTDGDDDPFVHERSYIISARKEMIQKDYGIEFDPDDFYMPVDDRQRDNDMDIMFNKVNHLRDEIISAFDNECVSCGSDKKLEIDHFAVPKSNGGNFMLISRADGALTLNVAVLCKNCNEEKGNARFLTYFNYPQITKVLEIHKMLMPEVLLYAPLVEQIELKRNR